MDTMYGQMCRDRFTRKWKPPEWDTNMKEIFELLKKTIVILYIVIVETILDSFYANSYVHQEM